MARVIAAVWFLILAGPMAIGQLADPTATFVPITNQLPDGSMLSIQAVSYGVIHRMPWPSDKPAFFKSASPTILFTTLRQAPDGHYLTFTNDFWTKAEALDKSGHWCLLRNRVEPRPATNELQNSGSWMAPQPNKMWETWEFPQCPEPSPWIQVRIWLTRDSTNIFSVKFRLPNDAFWREQCLEKENQSFRPQEWLEEELWRAATDGDTNYVKDLISQGANPNSTGSEYISVLAIACQNGNEEVVRYLLDHGANINARGAGPLHWTALMAAAANGRRLEIIRLLVERGADVNIQGGGGWTALFCAVSEGDDVETLKYLLSKGANPNLQDEHGDRPIDLAKESISSNRVEMIKILSSAQTAH